MNENQRFLLLSNKIKIAQDLYIEDVSSYLQSKFVIDVNELEIINSELTSSKKVEKLISTIIGKQANYFQTFYNALQYAEYDHLAQLLAAGTTDHQGAAIDSDDDTPDLETLLREGNVPKLPNIYVERKSCELQVQQALYKLKDKEAWVLLYGMSGCGKSTLVIASLANERLVRSCFPGGVFWLNVGHTNDSQLLTKLQNLCAMIDGERTYSNSPLNLEEASYRLRLLFLRQHPRSLLVVDDLWSEDHAKYFDIRVRLLVTTRNLAVADRIRETVYKIPVQQNFTIDQGRRVLAQWAEKDVESLPKEADQIIEESQGSPLAVSMVGALLRKNNRRWDYYLNQLKDQKTSKVKSKLAYDYPSLYEALAISFDDLEIEDKDRFESLAVFSDSTSIPPTTLQIYWELDVFETEDALQVFIDRSLIERFTTKENNSIYTLHNLQAAFLKERAVKSSKLQLFHLTMLNRYAGVEADDYIPHNIIHHMLQAGKRGQAVKCLTDLRWVSEKVRAIGPAQLIQNYNSVTEDLQEKENEDVLIDLKRFFSLHSHLFANNHHGNIDLIQLALTQPTSSKVFELAKLEAPKTGNVYFNWINRPEEISNNLQLTLSLHEDGVNCCNLSHDCTLAVSCGVDGILKVWEIKTGKERLVIEGHSGEEIKWCEFSPNDQNIVTCGGDNNIKVWKVADGKIIMTISGHTEEVVCCRYSKEGKYLASVAMDNFLMVWQEGKLYSRFEGHTDVVNHCSFSNDCLMLASCSNDCTLKVWDIEMEKLKISCSSEDFFTCCAFSNDDKNVLASTLSFLKIYSVEDGILLKTLSTESNILHFTLNNSHVALSQQDMIASLLSENSGEVLAVYRGHKGWLTSVNFCKNDCLVTSSSDGTCKVWAMDVNIENTVSLLDVFDVHFGEKNSLVVAATNQKSVKLFNDKTLVATSGRFTSRISFCCFTKDVSCVIVVCENGEIKVLNLHESLSEKRSFTPYNNSHMVCFALNAETIVLCYADFHCVICNIQDGSLVKKFIAHNDIITKCEFLDKDKFITTSFDGTLKIWSNKGIEMNSCEHEDESAVISFSISQQLLCSCAADGSFYLWSLDDSSKRFRVTEHEDVVRCVQFSSDGEYLATASDDGIVNVWRTSDITGVCQCNTHTNEWVVGVSFNQNNTRIIIATNNIKLFDLRGKLLQTFQCVGEKLSCVTTSPDLSKCVTVDNLGYLYLLSIDT